MDRFNHFCFPMYLPFIFLKTILRNIAMNMFVHMSPYISLIISLGYTMGRWNYKIKENTPFERPGL